MQNTQGGFSGFQDSRSSIKFIFFNKAELLVLAESAL